MGSLKSRYQAGGGSCAQAEVSADNFGWFRSPSVHEQLRMVSQYRDTWQGVVHKVVLHIIGHGTTQGWLPTCRELRFHVTLASLVVTGHGRISLSGGLPLPALPPPSATAAAGPPLAEAMR